MILNNQMQRVKITEMREHAYLPSGTIKLELLPSVTPNKNERKLIMQNQHSLNIFLTPLLRVTQYSVFKSALCQKMRFFNQKSEIR